MRQLIKANISSIRFLALGDVHPELAAIIPADALIHSRSLISRAGSVDPKIARPRLPITGPLACTEKREFRNVLLPNGDVTLCCMDFERRHVLGNLLHDGYEDLFRRPGFRLVADRMNGASGSLLCRMCERATPNRRITDHDNGRAPLGSASRKIS
ncbi:SPASM domain-containing protein [Bradyrhizobium sp. NBAIM08]|uniref:SPASM domain-containing protein n=1 Tax=Bradyrhizobium sp. NBAIM08 TaxID=2793815 RepID=UPI001CD42249|nr:SPASM domain-containing protein [Bradyrhizobium sp. NBAIM08]